MSIANITKVSYANAIQLAVQQKQSRLLSTVTPNEASGTNHYFDFLAKFSTKKKTTSNSDVELQPMVYTRRQVTPEPIYNAVMLDNEDKVRASSDPTSQIILNQVAAMNRQIDDTIIKSLNATVYDDKSNATVFPTATQQVAVDYVETGSATNSNFPLAKVRRAQEILQTNECFSNEEEIFCVYSPSQLKSILRVLESLNATAVTSQSIESGIPTIFNGWTWIVHNGLPKSGNNRSVFVYAKSAVQWAWLQPIKTEMEKVPMKHFNPLAYIKGDFGCVRGYDERVVEILCDETK